MKTVEVKDDNGVTVATMQVPDDVDPTDVARRITPIWETFDRLRRRRAAVVTRIRNHIVTGRSGGNITCACGAVVPDANAWAVHVVEKIFPTPGA